MFKNFKEFNLPQIEEKVLDFWKKYNIFEKSLAQRRQGGETKVFNFWEGPPTANGTPGLHHLLARSYKDIITRYKSMKGFYVPRRAGWDTHGLPVEIGVEKELGFKSKKDIEKFGIAEFNRKCKESVWRHKEEFEQITDRMGYWVDMKHAYVTYKKSYIESLWWIFSEAWKKKLLYKGHRVVPWCSRCGTALSSHEIAQGYKETTDTSVYLKFRLKKGQKISKDFTVKDSAYILSWTTTPWTLPGNVALAVGEKIKYVVLEHKLGPSIENWIIAKDIYEKPDSLFKDNPLAKTTKGKTIELSGKDLIGLSYQPLWDIKPLKNKKAYQVYGADFVTTTDGTGVVHTAVMYGEDDYKLGVKVGLPQYHTVDAAGKFTDDVPKLGGYYVKSKETEGKIIDYLDKNNFLYKTTPYVHEYPFCWRCSTPLLYYAMDSWFIAMSKLRGELISANNRVNWIPNSIKQGRFGEWIKEVKDWAISRERYWGTPLPIWQCKNGHIKVVDSIEGLMKNSVQNNKFFIMRHGEAEHNVKGVLASGPETKGRVSSLTKKGISENEAAVSAIKKQKIDVIFTSPYKRTIDTAKTISKATKAKVIEDKRLGEIEGGIFNWKTEKEFKSFFDAPLEQFLKAPSGGESLTDVRNRVFNFLDEIDNQYAGQNILIISHGDPLWMMEAASKNLSSEEAMSLKPFAPSEWREIVFKNISYNNEGKIDLHRPYIDKVHLKCTECNKGKKTGKNKEVKMERVLDVADAWFDSGAMPFASVHYPFENKDLIDKKGIGFPADYIAEGMDQTRGWFYTLLAVSVILGHKEAYKNVISLGLIHDKFGQKMSKSKGNTVDPWEMIRKYGVDVVRWYFYTVNPPGEQKDFDEADLTKVSRRFFAILYNSYVFSETLDHGHSQVPEHPHPNHVLDKWILSRLNETIKFAGEKLDAYEIGLAARSIESLVDDLSRWYIRRSRQRNDMVKILLHCLLEISKMVAPFAPFFADALYKSLIIGDKSVHLESFPEVHAKFIDKDLNKKMDEVRRLAAMGLAKRAEANIKVRQPLASLKIKTNNLSLDNELLEVLADEINVKKVIVDKTIEGEVLLDTNISEDLKREGMMRELNRAIQSLRQEADLKPGDKIDVYIEVAEAAAQSFNPAIKAQEDSLKNTTGAVQIHLKKTDKFDAESETKVYEIPVWIGIKKI